MKVSPTLLDTLPMAEITHGQLAALAAAKEGNAMCGYSVGGTRVAERRVGTDSRAVRCRLGAPRGLLRPELRLELALLDNVGRRPVVYYQKTGMERTWVEPKAVG